MIRYLLIKIKIYLIFFYWVYDTVHYNIENWVWICWSAWTRTLATLCCMLFDLISSLEILVLLGWPSTVGAAPPLAHRAAFSVGVSAIPYHLPADGKRWW